MPVVIRIGGSVIASPTNLPIINQYAKLLEKLRKNGYEVMTVVGGGALAREFIKIGNQLGLAEEAQDWLAIHISRLYALLLSLKLGKKGTETIPRSIGNAVKALEKDKIVIMGGLKPGMTTDTVAAYLAQETKAQLLVKATDQDGIYNKDPRKHTNARKLDKITYHDLTQLFAQNRHKAGIHQILDPVAVKILYKTNIKTIIVNGYDPQNVQQAIEGKKIGTVITKE
jgi:uridylate kinase